MNRPRAEALSSVSKSLTFVTNCVTCVPSCSMKRAPFARALSIGRSRRGAACRKDALRSRAAAGQHACGTRTAAGGVSLDWDRRGAVTPAASRQRRSVGLELNEGIKALARAAAERRKASAPRKQMSAAHAALLCGRAAPERHRQMATFVGAARHVGWMRLSALRSLLIAGGESLARGRGQNSDTTCREPTAALASLPSVRRKPIQAACARIRTASSLRSLFRCGERNLFLWLRGRRRQISGMMPSRGRCRSRHCERLAKQSRRLAQRIAQRIRMASPLWRPAMTTTMRYRQQQQRITA